MEGMTTELMDDQTALEVIGRVRWFGGRLCREIDRGLWRPVAGNQTFVKSNKHICEACSHHRFRTVEKQDGVRIRVECRKCETKRRIATGGKNEASSE